MAKRVTRAKKPTAIERTSFGGTENLGSTKMDGYDHDVQSVEVQSKTKLQDDRGEGKYVIIRKFTFGMNPKAFQEAKPDKQTLFNYHLKGIEIALWADGWKIFTDVQPQLTFDTAKLQYSIFVGAIPMNKYNTINAQVKTLGEIAAS